MPDGRTSDARTAQREAHVAEIVARCGNIYTHFRLSPPMALRAAAEHWVGLSLDEIACVVEDNLIYEAIVGFTSVAPLNGSSTWSRQRSGRPGRRSTRPVSVPKMRLRPAKPVKRGA